jgi:hypothetical protein
MTEPNQTDEVKLDQGFQITCKNCGSTECRIDNDMGVGSSQTGAYGSIEIVCPACNQVEIIMGG